MSRTDQAWAALRTGGMSAPAKDASYSVVVPTDDNAALDAIRAQAINKRRMRDRLTDQLSSVAGAATTYVLSLSELSNLRWVYLACGLFFLAAAIAFYIVWGGATGVSNSSISTVIVTSTAMGYKAWLALTINPTLFAAIASTIAFLSAFYDQITWSCFKATSMSGRSNWTRWVGDSLSVPLLYVTSLAMLGVNDILQLLSLFALSHISVISGALVETINAPGNASDTIVWWPLMLNTWFGFLAQLPYFIFLANSSELSSLPVFGVSAYALLLFLWFGESVLQWMYYSSLGRVTDKDLEAITSGNMSGNTGDAIASYYRGKFLGYDSLMALLSAVVKVVVICLVALSYNGNTDFATNHFSYVNATLASGCTSPL